VNARRTSIGFDAGWYTEASADTPDMLEIALDNALMEHERLRASLVAERHMLAAEVHDSLAQGLAFMRMRMSLLHDALDRGERVRALKYADDVDGQLGEAHARLRSLITQFRHTAEQGLVEALRVSARGFEERTGVALRIESRATELRLPPDHQAEVFQIVQEALANVIKHAGARNARVLIERSPRRLQVMVEDDGCGLATEPATAAGSLGAAQARSGHHGIAIMRERARRIGGREQAGATMPGDTQLRVAQQPHRLCQPMLGDLVAPRGDRTDATPRAALNQLLQIALHAHRRMVDRQQFGMSG